MVICDIFFVTVN